MHDAGLTRAKRTAGSRGFTFVELLIAVGILSIVAVGTAATMVQGPRLSRVAREEMIVRSAMRGMVAEISAAPYSEVAAAFHGQGFSVPGLAASDVDADKLPGVIRVDEIREETVRYFRVTLTVNWQGIEGTRTLQSTHFVSNVRGDTANVLSTASSIEGGETVSTDPNLAYYDRSNYAEGADGQTEQTVDPVLLYLAQEYGAAESETSDTDGGAQDITDPVETVDTSMTTKEETTDVTEPR